MYEHVYASIIKLTGQKSCIGRSPLETHCAIGLHNMRDRETRRKTKVNTLQKPICSTKADSGISQVSKKHTHTGLCQAKQMTHRVQEKLASCPAQTRGRNANPCTSLPTRMQYKAVHGYYRPDNATMNIWTLNCHCPNRHYPALCPPMPQLQQEVRVD